LQVIIAVAVGGNRLGIADTCFTAVIEHLPGYGDDDHGVSVVCF